MREYYKKNYKRKRYQKDYHLQPHIIEAKKEYIKKYNARPDVKAKRHEWYVQKKIKDNENENDNLHAINAERFTNV